MGAETEISPGSLRQSVRLFFINSIYSGSNNIHVHWGWNHVRQQQNLGTKVEWLGMTTVQSTEVLKLTRRSAI